jgi:hypothetical protein
MKREWTLFLVSCALSILALEGLVRIFASQRGVIVPPCVLAHADLGSVTRPDCRHFEAAPLYAYHVRSNGLGARMDEEVDLSGARTRVFVMGDSFTFGWGVERSQSFVGLLAERLKERSGSLQLVNMGVGAYSTGHHRKQLELFAPRIRPRLALLFLNNNDLLDNANQDPNYRTFEARRDADGRVVTMPRRVFPPLKRFLLLHTPYAWLNQHSHLWIAVKELAKRLVGPRGRPPAFGFDASPATREEVEWMSAVTLEHLDRLGEAFERSVDGALVVWIPHPCQLGLSDRPASSCPFPFDEFTGRVSDLLEKRTKTRWLDPLVDFRSSTSGREFADVYFADGHFNALGNELYADAIGPGVGDFLERFRPAAGR